MLAPSLARSHARYGLMWLIAAPLLGAPTLLAQESVDPDVEAGLDLCSDDWSGIREAYQESRHAIRQLDTGFSAFNPGQRWVSQFDGRGFTTTPLESGWTWGLQLEAYGFEGVMTKITAMGMNMVALQANCQCSPLPSVALPVHEVLHQEVALSPEACERIIEVFASATRGEAKRHQRQPPVDRLPLGDHVVKALARMLVNGVLVRVS